MFASFYISARSRRRILRIAVAAAAALLLGTAAYVVAANMLVRRAVEAAAEFVAARYDADLTITTARFFPLRGAVLRGVTARIDMTPSESQGAASATATLTVDRLRIKMPVRAVLNLREYESRPLPPVMPWNATHVLLSVLGQAAAAGVLPSSVDLHGLLLHYTVGDAEPVTVGVDRLALANRPRDAVLTASVASLSPSINASAWVDYGQNTITANAELRDVPLSRRPFVAGKLGGILAIRVDERGRLEFDGAIVAGDVVLELPSIADEPAENIVVQYEFAGELDPHLPLSAACRQNPVLPPPEFPKGELRLTRGDLVVNQVRMSVVPIIRGLFAGSRDLSARRCLEVDLNLDESPIQAVLDALPSAVGGAAASMVVDGSITWNAHLAVPFYSISEMEWASVATPVGFAVREIDPSVNVYKVNDAFVHTIRDESVGYSRTVRIPAARNASAEWMLLHSEHTAEEIDTWRTEALALASDRPTEYAMRRPGGVAATPDNSLEPDPTYRYVYVDDMSPWVIRAILTAEDGDFFWYGGVNPVTLVNAIARNAEAGEIVLGASTISMQLVKMLFLDSKRIFSRKLQEVYLVYLMEHLVPVQKDRILELYINLAEFGPGVFGIHHASDYYFDKHPRDLTAGEATWLASILPSPKTYHRYFDDRWISDGWFIRMISLFDTMLVRGRMTQAEYDAAVQQRPLFRSEHR